MYVPGLLPTCIYLFTIDDPAEMNFLAATTQSIRSLWLGHWNVSVRETPTRSMLPSRPDGGLTSVISKLGVALLPRISMRQLVKHTDWLFTSVVCSFVEMAASMDSVDSKMERVVFSFSSSKCRRPS